MDHIVYDTETTDVDVQHAQVLQFAAIRADENFTIVSEEEILVKRLPYVVPAPSAMEVTGLDVTELDDPDRRTEYWTSGQIEKSMRPRFGKPQVNITFNGIKFDDEMLRTMLFRNLRNPWFSSGREIRRVDLLPLIRLIHTIDESLISIPKRDDGQFSWKLADVCGANGIELDAHDAMEDVRGTLALAHLIKKRAPTIWAEAVNCGNPANSESRLADQLARGAPAWVFTYFGKPELIPAGVLATDGRKKWILADLRKSVEQVTAPAIAEALYTAESSYRVVRSNAGQLVLSDEIAEMLIGRAEMDAMRKAASAMKENSSLRTEAGRSLKLSTFETPVAPTSEERMYAGFATDGDKSRMNAFHNADTWMKRAQVTFEDERMSDFAARIVMEAVIDGRASDIPEDVVAKLISRCLPALERPFATEDATPLSIAKAISDGAGDHWKTWADGAFSSLSDVIGKAKPQEGKAYQTSFSFGQ
jgi:exodeoxyribonuclease-1